MSALQAFRERFGLLGSQGAQRSDRARRDDLVGLFREMGFTRGAEIGVWEGGFAAKLCQAIPGLQLTCVDPWCASEDYKGEKKNDQARLDAAYQTAKDLLRPYPCTFLRMTSAVAAPRFPDGSLDFIFIDGNHRKPFVMADLTAWAPKVRPGGIVAGHDYRTDARKPFIEVQQAVDEFTTARRIAPWFVLAADKSPSYFWVVP